MTSLTLALVLLVSSGREAADRDSSPHISIDGAVLLDEVVVSGHAGTPPTTTVITDLIDEAPVDQAKVFASLVTKPGHDADRSEALHDKVENELAAEMQATKFPR